MWTAWTTSIRQDWCRGAHVCCPPRFPRERPSLLPADGALQTFDGRLEGAVLLDASLGDAVRVDDRRVVATEELPDVGEGCVHQAPAEVHRDLARHDDV